MGLLHIVHLEPGSVLMMRRSLQLLAVAFFLATTCVVQAADPAPVPADQPSEFNFEPGLAAHVGGAVGANVGLDVFGTFRFGNHGVEVVALVAGGSHLRTGASLRYRLIGSTVSWWLGAGVAFDALWAGDYTVWTRWTTFGTGLDIHLLDFLFIGFDFTFFPSLSPLSSTLVTSPNGTSRTINYESDRTLDDLARGVFRPGLVVGLRL